MALTAQTQNWITDTMSLADTMLDVQEKNAKLRARATVNSLASAITDAALTELRDDGTHVYPSLAHLTKAELVDAVTVFTEFVAWMGDPNDAASRAAKLLKLRG